ncbi:MAG: FAD-dependent oxidoreductase [Oscillospiraceae bacterium]|nr:FAD-dependent oxidoreductase [Oscillospiraceae bacterium]
MAIHIESEAERCLNCKVPLCRQYCPISTPIPHIIQLFKEKKVMEAGKELFENNPMSVICATVCNHEAQCAGHCILGQKSTPVQFYDIEKYISDSYLDRIRPEPVAKNGRHVAIVGSGPAGLTVAILLAQKGCEVTVFERKHFIGGMLRYGIPDFRLPRTILDRYQKLLDRLGVRVRTATTIGGALKLEDLLRDGYDAVFVGTGAWRPKTLGVRGECGANVQFGVSYLENAGNVDLGRTVAIIGMGNVAMDVARTAFRHGAERVMLFSRGKHANASSHEMSYAALDGAEFIYGKQIVAIRPEGTVFRDAILDDTGAVVGYSEQELLVHADSVVIAISQRPKDKLLLSTDHLEGNAKGLLIVDENHMTTVKGVFSAGDVVTGPMTVVHAVRAAKETAEAMLRYMNVKDIVNPSGNPETAD